MRGRRTPLHLRLGLCLLFAALAAPLAGCFGEQSTGAGRWAELSIQLDELMAFDRCDLLQNEATLDSEFVIDAALYAVRGDSERLLAEMKGLSRTAGIETVPLGRTLSGWVRGDDGSRLRLDISLREEDRGGIQGPAAESLVFERDASAGCWHLQGDDADCAASGEQLGGNVSLVSMIDGFVVNCRDVAFFDVGVREVELLAPRGDERVGVYDGPFDLRLDVLVTEPDGWIDLASCEGHLSVLADPRADDDFVGSGSCTLASLGTHLELVADQRGRDHFAGELRPRVVAFSDAVEIEGDVDDRALRASFVVPTVLGDDIEARWVGGFELERR